MNSSARGTVRNGLAAVVGAIAIFVASAATVWAADNLVPTQTYNPTCTAGGETGGVLCKTDDFYWSYFRQSTLEYGDQARVADVLRDEFGPTDLAVAEDTTPEYSGADETDVIYKESAVPGGNEGITWCNDPTSGYECDQHYVDMQPDVYTSRGLICHESGHAVGLTHGLQAYGVQSQTDPALGCMRTPTGSTQDNLGSQQITNINASY